VADTSCRDTLEGIYQCIKKNMEFYDNLFGMIVWQEIYQNVSSLHQVTAYGD